MLPNRATEQLFLKFFSPDPPHEEGSERIYSLPWQPVLETSYIRVVKRALVNNRNQENGIKKVSSTPHLLIATEISELRPVLSTIQLLKGLGNH